MNTTAPHHQKPPNTGLQKALLFCAVIIICLLVFLFVQVFKPQAPAVVVAPDAATPAEAESAGDGGAANQPASGVREAVLLEKVGGTLELGEPEGQGGRRAVRLRYPPGGNVPPAEGALELMLRSGYVQGFLLELPALTEPEKPKSFANEFERGVYDGRVIKYGWELDAQSELVHGVLSSMLAALDTGGEVPASATLMWEAEVENMQKSGDSFSEEMAPFLFSARRTRAGKLLISLSRV